MNNLGITESVTVSANSTSKVKKGMIIDFIFYCFISDIIHQNGAASLQVQYNLFSRKTFC